MVQSNRTSDVFAVADSWRHMLASQGLTTRTTRPAALRVPGERSLGCLDPLYRIEGLDGVRRELARYRATRRRDGMPVLIVVPHGRHADRFVNAAPFVDASRRGSLLRHRSMPRVHACGLLDDGRPYAVIARTEGEALDRVALRLRGFDWPTTRAIALRLCGAIEAARAVGLAPRRIDLEACTARLEHGELVEVAFDDVPVAAHARLEESDVRAIAMLIHELLGTRPRASAVDNLVLRCMGALGFTTIRDLTIAIAAIDESGVVQSHGANHAAHRGELTYDHAADDAIAPGPGASARSGPLARACADDGTG